MPGAPVALAAAISAGLIVAVPPDLLRVGTIAAVVEHKVPGIGIGVERGRFRRGVGIRRRGVRWRGRAGVQDEGSQLGALALAQAPIDGPDRVWLDLCAGPGGKTRVLTHLAAGQRARLVAGELRPHRARRGKDAAPQAVVVVADGLRIPWKAATFDRVLADVPCSGLGSLRRRPEARWRKTPADIPELAALQRGLLSSAIDSARPGGVVAYVTCSPHLAETHDVVSAVAAARTDVTILDAPAFLPEVPDLAAPSDNRFAQFWPHRHGTDAMFLALLRRG